MKEPFCSPNGHFSALLRSDVRPSQTPHLAAEPKPFPEFDGTIGGPLAGLGQTCPQRIAQIRQAAAREAGSHDEQAEERERRGEQQERVQGALLQRGQRTLEPLGEAHLGIPPELLAGS